MKGKRRKKQQKFRKGEKVWFYPSPTVRPRLRRQVTIIDVLKRDGIRWFRTSDPSDSVLFPTFHGASQLKKIRKRKRKR